LLPAEPLRNIHASGSPPVLSQYAFSGWCPSLNYRQCW
jgi:hypothetical protein